MIRITNGVMTLKVSRSAYEHHYKHCGFKESLVAEDVAVPEGVTLPTSDGETPSAQNFAEENASEEEPSEAGTEDEIDLSEIPLSEMDFSQLCAYAEQLGLDYDGIRSKKELRALIKNNL